MSLGSEKITISGNFPFLKTKGRTHVSFYLKMHCDREYRRSERVFSDAKY